MQGCRNTGAMRRHGTPGDGSWRQRPRIRSAVHPPCRSPSPPGAHPLRIGSCVQRLVAPTRTSPSAWRHLDPPDTPWTLLPHYYCMYVAAVGPSIMAHDGCLCCGLWAVAKVQPWLPSLHHAPTPRGAPHYMPTYTCFFSSGYIRLTPPDHQLHSYPL